LQNDPAALEKFARERYLMKRDGEDVYIIEDSLAPTK
jgi:cell division protein DivIC